MPPGGRLWLPAAEIRRVSHQVADLVADYLISLRTARSTSRRRATWSRPCAARLGGPGETADVLLADFAAHVAPYPFGNGHRASRPGSTRRRTAGRAGRVPAAAMNPSVAGGNHAAVHWSTR